MFLINNGMNSFLSRYQHVLFTVVTLSSTCIQHIKLKNYSPPISQETSHFQTCNPADKTTTGNGGLAKIQ